MGHAEPRYTPEQLRAAMYENKPDILNGLRSTLSELLSIARTYSGLQKYDVTLNAFNAISRLLADYLRVRDGDLVMPTSIQALVGPTDFRFDAVLTDALEGVSSLHKAAITRSDVQLSAQITDALEYLALQSVTRKTLVAPPGENPTTAFIRAYMFGPVQDGAMRGLDDVTMAGARTQTSIGRALLGENLYLTAQGAINDVEKLAYIAIAQRKAHVTGAPVRGIAEMLMTAVSEPVTGSYTITAALRALRRVCEAELQFKTLPQDLSLKFALGAFLDITEPTALANIEACLVEKLSVAIKEGSSSRADAYEEALRELNHNLWDHLVAIGTAAAKTESFALFDVNLNISTITKQLLWLYGLLNRSLPDQVDQASAHRRWMQEKFANDLLKELKWIVGATYWRIFDALEPPINTYLVWEFFPTLSDIGIRALDAGVPSLAESAISELRSIALTCIEKPTENLRSAARVAVFIARIGIIAKKTDRQEILDISVEALREFDQRYLAKQRELRPDAERYEVVLLSEIDELRRELEEHPWFLDPEEASFFTRVTAEDIESFAARLR